MRTKLSGIAFVLIVFVSARQSDAQYQGYIAPGGAPGGAPGAVHAGYAAQPLASLQSEPGTAIASDSPDCDGAGSAGSCEERCCIPAWTFFGEFLYMRPRNAEVVYGVPFNGPVGSPPEVPIQIGRTGITNLDYEPAFRAGFARALDDCASLGVTYTYFDGGISDRIGTSVPYAIRSMVSHPSTWVGNSDGLDANAAYGIDFDLVDLDFRRVFTRGEQYSLNYLIGVRYAYLDQAFRSQYAVNGLETVLTDIRFEGGGIRLGVEGQRYARNTGWMVYGRGTAGFIAGDFRARYAQGQAFDTSVVDTTWRAGRIVPVLDLEVGIGLTSRNGRSRLTAGYLVSAWCNTVKTDEWIQAVQTNNFIGLGDTLTFDGLTVRAELQY